MTEARPTLEYRSAADDRRQNAGRTFRFVPQVVLVTTVVLSAYFFLLCALAGIVLAVAWMVSNKAELGVAAAAGFGLSGLCFALMMACARVMR